MRSRCHVALEADDEAEFSNWIVRFSGNKLLLNARTAHAGRVRVELLGPDRRPLPGRTQLRPDRRQLGRSCCDMARR